MNWDLLKRFCFQFKLSKKSRLLLSRQSFSDFMIVFVVSAVAWIGTAWCHVVKNQSCDKQYQCANEDR